MNAFAAEIRETIAANGPMPVEHFMALALSHPQLGYYMTRDPFGAAGDFVTAPEISQIYGELIGLWAAETWVDMGAPSPLRLIELGPGRGTMMADALRAARVAPEFFAALDVHLVENSPVLGRFQQEALKQTGAPISWHDHFDDVPAGPAIILASEFFDALPVRQYIRLDGAWHERLIGLDAAGELAFGAAPDAEPYLEVEAQPYSVIEIGAVGQRAMAAIAQRLANQGGAALVIDYGHTHTQLGETLQALRAHQRVDPLVAPGEADLTAHVDFASLSRAAQAEGARVFGPVTQAKFLTRLGIFERASGLKRRASKQQAAEIDAAVARLLATALEPGAGDVSVPGMGELFKAMAVTGSNISTAIGFTPEESS